MSRIAERFEQLRQQQRTALIPYITGGDPDPATTLPLLHTLADAGADLIELGVPFSDPMADGPVIQAACERALAHGITLADILDMAGAFRRKDAHTPMILMGYCNPILAMGEERFANAAAAAGIDGVLVVDLPPEEADSMTQALCKQDIDPIFLLAPTTTEARIQTIAKSAQGFLYYVSVRGTTGVSALDFEEVARQVARIRSFSPLPVGVGFGIRDAETATQAAQCADAVIVGSALVECLRQTGDLNAAGAFMRELRHAMDATDPPTKESST